MRIILSLLLISICSLAFAQKDAITTADKLIEAKKYESAYKVLDEADPTNENPEIVIAKTDLFLNFFASSIMHRMFALTDLEPEQDILDIRGGDGMFSMFTFEADSILNILIDKYPENYHLRKTLGFYYHEIHVKYPQNWFEEDAVVVSKFVDNYKMAYENEIYDYWSAYGLGYAMLLEQDYESAIPYFSKSIKLKEDYPTSHYNLSYAYLYTDQRKKAIDSAKKAMDLYEPAEYKADAARIVAVTYQELGEFDKAIEYYKKSDEIQPDNYYTLKQLLETELSQNKKNYKDRTKQFLSLAPGNPTLYQDLLKMYSGNEKEDELLEFFTSQHSTFLSDDKANASLYFYKAIIQFDKKDFKKSKSNFEKSKGIFRKVFEPEHDVFEIIDSYTGEIE